MRRAVGYILNGARARAFNGWREMAEARRDALATMHRVAARWRNRRIVHQWQQWVEVVAALRAALALMQKVAAAFASRELRAAFNSWAGLREAMSRIRHFASIFALREARGLLARWREAARQGRLVRRVVMRMAQRVLAQCWAAWAGEAAASRDGTFSALQSCAARMRRLGMARAFNSLVDAVARRAALRATLRRVCSPRVTRALNTWRAMRDARNEHRRRVRRAAQMWVNSGLVLVFTAWARHFRRRTGARRAAAALTEARRGAWLRRWEYSTRLSSRVAESLAALMGRTVGAVFEAWAEATLEGIAFRAALRTQCEQLRALGDDAADALRVSCQRWFGLDGGPDGYFALRAWAEATEAARKAAAAARRALEWWWGRHAGRLLRRWRGAALHVRNAKLAVLASHLHCEGALMLKVFGGWRGAARRCAVMRLAVGASGRTALLRRGLQAWRDTATMAAVFGDNLVRSERQCKRHFLRLWRLAGAERAARAARVASLWYGRTAVALARRALRDWALSSSVFAARYRRSAVALARWGGASRRGCWVRWVDATARGARLEALREAAFALLASKAYAAWVRRAAELSRLSRALARLRHRLLDLCFGAMAQLLATKRKYVRRLWQRCVAMAWEGWRYFVLGRRNARASSAAMCARALGQEVAAAFWWWRDEAGRDGVMLRAWLSLRHAKARKAFLSWRQCCCEVRVLRSMLRRREVLLGGALGGWARDTLVRRRVAELAFSNVHRDNVGRLRRWHALAAHNAALRLRQEYLLSRTTWYARQAMLSHWTAATTSRSQLRRALGRYCFALCFRVMQAWRAHAAVAHEARGELLRAHANQLALEQHRRRARARLLHALFGAWRAHCSGRGQRRRLSHASSVALRRSRGLAVWRLNASLAAHEELLRDAAASHHRRTLWRRWAGRAAKAAHADGVGALLTRRRAYGATVRAMRAWRGVQQKGQRRRVEAASHWAATTASKCWRGWRGALEAKRRRRADLAASLADLVVRRQQHARRAALRDWRRVAARGVKRRNAEERLANAAAYHLQRLGGLVFFHWRALSWSRNWEKPGRFGGAAHGGRRGGGELQRQRARAAMLVRGSVAHQATTSHAFQQGVLTPPRSRSPSRSPAKRRTGGGGGGGGMGGMGGMGGGGGTRPHNHPRELLQTMSPTGLSVAVALGSQLVGGGATDAPPERGRGRERSRPGPSPEARLRKLEAVVAAKSPPRRGAPPPPPSSSSTGGAGRRLFESSHESSTTSGRRSAAAGGFLSFGDWVNALQTG